MSATVAVARRSPAEEQVLGNVDLFGLVLSMLHNDDCWEDEDSEDSEISCDSDGDSDADDTEGDRRLATRAAQSLCLASKSVRAAVLASVQRVRMDAPLPVLQHMASLVSLHVGGPGTLDPSQLRQLTRLEADDVSSPQAVSATMQLTRL
jgi:hypothetical protein